jgi:hypothetical protein
MKPVRIQCRSQVAQAKEQAAAHPALCRIAPQAIRQIAAQALRAPVNTMLALPIRLKRQYDESC